MTHAVKRALETIDALPLAERQEVIVELLRRAAQSVHDVPTTGDLVGLADEVFLELDARESGR
jgi:hypothetical protein